MTTAIIDADGLVYSTASAVQRGIRWDDDIYTTHADLNAAKDQLRLLLAATCDDAGASSMVLCFSCSSRSYFRHRLWPDYKAKRHGERPLVLKDLMAWAKETYQSYEKPSLEADDVVGILATNPLVIKGKKVIVSNDKDLLQVPGLHHNWQSGRSFEISPEEALHQVWLQTLTGDATDNYPGCPGIGEKRALGLLASGTSDLWPELALKAYRKAGLELSDLVTQFNVAHILTHEHYDYTKKEPILWQPSLL